MISLRDIFKEQTGFLRGLKVSYVINNLLHAKKLRINRDLYKKFGLRKSVFAPLGSQDFQRAQPAELPWLDRPGSMMSLEKHPAFSEFPPETQTQIRQFIEQGFIILKGFYSSEEVESLNSEVSRLINDQITGFNYTGRKIMDAYRFSALIDRQFFRNAKLLKLLEFLMGRKVKPFQTIHFLEGSEQRAHSDSIHMSTYPPGYLIAAWTALEDIDDGNGPLFYYPGSHRLPYVTTQDYQSGNTFWSLGGESNRKYEDKIADLLKDARMEKSYFHAQKGDVLIWHANLIHGGAPIKRQGATRKSMVAHYFCEGVICYHEITQRPAIL